jgi:hypothetical protein
MKPTVLTQIRTAVLPFFRDDRLCTVEELLSFVALWRVFFS